LLPAAASPSRETILTLCFEVALLYDGRDGDVREILHTLILREASGARRGILEMWGWRGFNFFF
jgi:hypothetical protein